MSYSSEDETDISDSELDEYVDRCYVQLQNGDPKVKLSDEVYRCPYCPGKKKLVYQFQDLIQHASDVGKGSQNKDIKHKGKHLGLVKYLKDDVDHDQEDLSSKFTELSLELPPNHGVNKLFVWPWMGILANVDVEGSISKLRNDLINRGFDPVRVRPLKGTFSVVEFKKDWSGFYNAMMFEKEFEVDHRGKKDYSTGSVMEDKLYGWIARDDDYKSKDVIGEYLQKNGDLKTIADLETDEKRKTGLLIANLDETIGKLMMRIDELERKHCASPAASL
ncbi:hypothetical protein ACJIZ3_012545 [Penstemon smallii]|uniref:Uncharacterized protein n=1 Tax=Penstemon smallii TaxID=265156 RepID=A0ABD3UQL1_9LAMI